MCHFQEIEMCHFREIEMYHSRGIEKCDFREIEICYFRELKYFFKLKLKYNFRQIEICIWGQRSGVWGEVRYKPLLFFVRIFFSVRTAFNFLNFFLSLERFFSQFSGLQRLLIKIYSKLHKKVSKRPKIVKIESDKKGHIELPFLFTQKFHTVQV